MNRLQSPRVQGWVGSAALHAAVLAAVVILTAAKRELTPPSVFQWDVAMRTIAAPAARLPEPQAAVPTPRAAKPVTRRPQRERAPAKTEPRPVTAAAAARPSTAAPAQAEPPAPAEAAPAPSPENAGQNSPAVNEPAPASAVAAASATPDELLRRIHALKRYPYLALRNGWEGRVTIRAVLTPDGRLLEAHIQESSGYAALDRDALALVKRAAAGGGGPAGELHQAAVLIPITYRIER